MTFKPVKFGLKILCFGKNIGKKCMGMFFLKHGVYIVSNRKFTCNFHYAKAKYYRSSNAILGKLGKQRNPAVALQLISSIAEPVLTYGMEAMKLNKTQMQAIDHPMERSFMKVYQTFDKRIIRQCQYYGSHLPTSLSVDLKRCRFLKKLLFIQNNLLFFISQVLGKNEWVEIAERYSSRVDMFYYNFHNIIYERFQKEVIELV